VARKRGKCGNFTINPSAIVVSCLHLGSSYIFIIIVSVSLVKTIQVLSLLERRNIFAHSNPQVTPKSLHCLHRIQALLSSCLIRTSKIRCITHRFLQAGSVSRSAPVLRFLSQRNPAETCFVLFLNEGRTRCWCWWSGRRRKNCVVLANSVSTTWRSRVIRPFLARMSRLKHGSWLLERVPRTGPLPA
jgi:hypothetical protein